jgi:Domain of unknown function (DUF1707)
VAREVRGDIDALRAADVDRQKVADQLKEALDEGRLTLHEYDDRVRDVYAARTYRELLVLVADLPRRPGEAKPKVKLPTALLVLWTIWASLTVVNLVVFGLVVMTVDGPVYPWPVWMLVPGAALAAVTVGVQAIRHR